MKYCGIKLDNISKVEARQKIRDFLNGGGQYKIFTPNPEMVVRASTDDNFKEVLNAGDLNLCDGFGLSLTSGVTRIPGTDFMLEICGIAAEEGRGVFLLGSGSEDVVKNTANKLQTLFPKLNIVGFDPGPEISNAKDSDEDFSLVIDKINQAKPDVLFVAFGMVKQETWISDNLAKIPSVKVAMGVGGAFDYISGSVKRAPCWMRKIGLEWLYRMYRQPQRIGRILNATIVFTALVIENFVCQKLKLRR